MVEFIIIFGVYLFAFFHGWIAREHTASKRIDELLTKYEEEVGKELDENTIQITIEEYQGKLYVYNMKDKSFLASGEDKKQLEANLAERFPGKLFAATKENLKEVGFK